MMDTMALNMRDRAPLPLSSGNLISPTPTGPSLVLYQQFKCYSS
jgi:hypothetical protein